MTKRLALLGVSGPAAGAPPPPGGFTPADIYGLEAWYYQPDLDYAAGTWQDQSGNSRNLTQATAGKRPALTAALAELNSKYGITADGVDDILNAPSFTYAQPNTVIALLRSITWSLNDCLWDGNTDISGVLQQSATTPELRLYAGTAQTPTPVLPVNRYGLVEAIYNGTASGLNIDGVRRVTGNAGASNMGGFTLGSRANEGAGGQANAQFSEVLLYRGVVGAYDLCRLKNEWIADDRYNIPVTFDPTSIAGCQLWLKGDDLGAVGSSISTWSDQSGAGRNATQGTGASQPTVAMGINSKKCASFDGVADWLGMTALTNFRSGYAVYRSRAGAGFIRVLSLSNNDASNGAAGLIGNELTGANTLNTWAPGNFSTDKTHTPGNVDIVSFIGGASSIEQFANGVSKGTGSVATSSSTASSMTLGARTFGNLTSPDQFAAMDLYEIILYTSVHTDSERQQITGYLANKYAVNAAVRPFDPLSIANCKGWWRVDGGCDVSADGASIGTIYDRSGNGNHLLQAIAGAKPLYQTNELNGRAIAEFDGVGHRVEATFTLAQPYSVILVVKQNAWTSGDTIFDAATTVANGRLNQDGSTPRILMYAGAAGPSSTALPIGSWGVVSTRWNGVSSKLSVNSILDGTSNAGAASPGGLAVGADADGNNAGNISVAEIIVYSADLSDADEASLEAYLNQEYDVGYKAPNHSSLVANLVAWWDASQETIYTDGATLTTITDRSGNSKNITTFVGTPTWNALAQNGRPAYRFSGGTTWTATIANLGLTGPQATIFFVGKSNSAAPTMVMQYGTGAGGSGSWYVVDNTATFQWSAQGTAATISSPNSAADWITNNIPHILSLRLHSGSGGVTGAKWLDGVLEAGVLPTTNFGNLSDGTFNFAGPAGGGLNSWTGDIYEIIIFNTALSDADRRAVENYLAQKYNKAV